MFGTAIMRLLTFKEAARQLSVSVRTIQRLIERGDLVCVNVSPSGATKRPRRRIREEDLTAFILVRQEEPRQDRLARRRRRRAFT